jgi:hypothetical protein
MTMPTYAVTGASGQLGRLVVQDLLARGVPASNVVAVVRNPGRAADLADRGVQVREADYSRPQTLDAGLVGVDRLLLNSSSEAGQRVQHHTNLIEAAKTARTARIVYTSMLNSDDSTNPLAAEHQASERALHASGVPFTLLRNGWYTENYTDQLDQYLKDGEIIGADPDRRKVDDADHGSTNAVTGAVGGRQPSASSASRPTSSSPSQRDACRTLHFQRAAPNGRTRRELTADALEAFEVRPAPTPSSPSSTCANWGSLRVSRDGHTQCLAASPAIWFITRRRVGVRIERPVAPIVEDRIWLGLNLGSAETEPARCAHRSRDQVTPRGSRCQVAATRCSSFVSRRRNASLSWCRSATSGWSSRRLRSFAGQPP